MKRIILTESQYKRLVRQDLNEQYKKIVYLNMRDAYDVNPEMLRVLEYLNYKFDSLYNKPLYVLKIEDGKVYIDTSKYTSEEIDYVKNQAKEYLSRNRNPNDSLLSNDFGFDSGIDSDYDWSEDEKVVDIEDSSKCYCYDLSTDEQIEYKCNSNLPVECGGTSEDIAVVDDNSNTAEVEDDESTVEVEGDDVVVDYEPNKTYSRTEYINLVKDIAIDQMKKHKIPASITIAQAVLESGNGNSKLARNGKNHFGIKCHGWTGDKSYHDDDRPNECFRNYDEIEDSFEDHSNFLKNNSRYNKLFDLDITDYKGWAKGLKKAGYATKSTYDKTLIDIIEKNNLQKYD